MDGNNDKRFVVIDDKSLLVMNRDIQTIEQLCAYEKQLIKKHNYSDLTKFHHQHYKLGYYSKFNCSFYVETTDQKELHNRYKFGYTTQSQGKLKKEYSRVDPDARFIIFDRGYVILEYLMLNGHQSFVRIKHDSGRLSEVVQTSKELIFKVLGSIVTENVLSSVLENHKQTISLEESNTNQPPYYVDNTMSLRLQYGLRSFAPPLRQRVSELEISVSYNQSIPTSLHAPNLVEPRKLRNRKR